MCMCDQNEHVVKGSGRSSLVLCYVSSGYKLLIPMTFTSPFVPPPQVVHQSFALEPPDIPIAM